MGEIRSRIAAIVKDLFTTLKILRVHLAGLEQTGYTGTDPQDAETISNALTQIENNHLLELVPADGKPPAKAVCDLMGEVHHVEQSLTTAEDLMRKHAPDPQSLYTSNLTRSSTMSSSTLTEILRTQRAMEVSVERSRAALTDPDLYEAAVSLMNLDDVEAILEISGTIPEKKSKGVKSTQEVKANLSFYAMVLQKTIDKNLHSPGAHEKIAKIMIHVERMKSQALGPARDRKEHPFSSVALFQQMVQTFHLVPSEPNLPLRELLPQLCPELGKIKTLSVDSPADLHKELTKLSGSLTTQTGFIVWRKLSSLQHHFRLLVDKEYLKETVGEISGGEGVSLKYVQATDSLTDTTVDKKVQKAGDYLLTIEGEKFWIILETLDGESFHCLRPWRGSSPLIPKHWFSSLVEKPGVVKNLNSQVVPSPRVENYNAILQEEILKHLRNPLASLQQMTRDESIREDIYWRNLRVAISKRSMVDFKNLRLLKTKPEKFLEQLHRVKEEYFGRLVQHIVERIEGFDEIKLSADAMLMARRELNLSGAQQLDKLRAGVAKAAEAIYQDMKKQSKNTSRSLELLWPEVLEETLARFINKRSGVYITLDNKSEVLRASIV